MDKLEEEILRLAAQKGYIPSDELDSGSAHELLAALLERGLLSPTLVEKLKAELLMESANTMADPPVQPATDSDPHEISVAVFGRYIQLRLVGQGGMARVYRGYDPTLNRTVAIKLFHTESERLMLEARNQAQVEHENVCKVYEVGEVEGRQYICMQFVHGKTLSEAADDMSLNQRLEVIQVIANAVHAAHKQGLVHRDIKPSNIMLERSEEGKWKPYILDFGLARIQTAPGITQQGVVMGTPSYMSPEQAGGEKADARSDVYSLGATLYELVARKPPFTGTGGGDVILKILQSEPSPLHKVVFGVPRDLETIVMKCLEKEPDARYQSARALAEDLSRYLDGESITARPISWPQRVWKKAKKNRVAASIVVSALLVTATLIFLLLLTRWKASVQAQYATEFGEEVRYIESLLLSTYTAPLHDVRPKLNFARKRLEQIERRVAKLGEWASGPGNNALGQGYLALKDYDRSLQFLQRAWDSGYWNPSTNYGLGKVQGILWRQALIDADHLTSESLREEMKKKAEANYLRPAIENLKLARVQAETPAYVEALIALYEKKYSLAFEKSRLALDRSSRPYEVWKLLGDIHFTVGREALDRGESSALQSLNEAGDAYNRSADLARSDQDIYFAEAERCIRLAYARAKQEEKVQALDRGSEACDKAIRIHPENDRAYLCKADVYLQYGINQMYSSGDARPNLQKSIAMAREASRYNPDHSAPYGRAATAYLRLAEYETYNTIDPRPSLKAGIAECQKALRFNPHDSETYFTLAGTYFFWGEYELNHGGNPLPYLQKVIEIMEKNLKSFLRDAYSFNLLGLAHLDIGEYRLKHGDDPRPALQESIKAYNSALKINPKFDAVLLNMGLAYQDMARYELSHGIEPLRATELSIRQYDQSLAAKTDWPYASHDRGLVYLLKGQYHLALGKDLQPEVAEALRAFQKALDLNSDLSQPHGSIAWSHLLLAKQEFARSKDPAGHLKNSRTAAEKYREKDASFYEPFRILGEIDLLEARWTMRKHRSPAALFDRGIAFLRKSIQLNKNDIELHRELGNAYRWEAEWKLEQNMSAATSIDRGTRALDDAAKLNASEPEMLAVQGALKLLKARESGDPAARIAFAREASQLLKRALAANRFLDREYQPLLQMAETIR